jgi:hypothetical protein
MFGLTSPGAMHTAIRLIGATLQLLRLRATSRVSGLDAAAGPVPRMQ